MNTATQATRTFCWSFLSFLILFVIGLVIVGTSAPFWQFLLIAVIAGLVGMAIGYVIRRRLT